MKVPPLCHLLPTCQKYVRKCRYHTAQARFDNLDFSAWKFVTSLADTPHRSAPTHDPVYQSTELSTTTTPKI